MRKLLFSVVLLSLVLTSCSLSPVNFGGEEDTTDKETTIRYILGEDSVHNAFEKALEVYGWFELCSMPMDFSKSETVNGAVYHKVISNECASFSELRTLVYSLFSVETGEKLLSEDSDTPPYIDIGGELYGRDFARGSDIGKGEYTADVEYISNTSVLYRVSVEIIDFDENAGIDNYRKVVGHEDYSYHYEYINNKWVFTDFYFFY